MRVGPLSGRLKFSRTSSLRLSLIFAITIDRKSSDEISSSSASSLRTVVASSKASSNDMPASSNARVRMPRKKGTRVFSLSLTIKVFKIGSALVVRGPHEYREPRKNCRSLTGRSVVGRWAATDVRAALDNVFAEMAMLVTKDKKARKGRI